MLDGRSVYQGDEVLERLLRKHGVSWGAAALRALVEGVAAAPEAEDREGWLDLVAPSLEPALKMQLLALEADLRAAQAAKAQYQPPAAERLARLREELARQGLAGFIVPRGDEHQGEYVPPRADRLAWLTGFTGSAGLAVVLSDAAAVFTDGRYTLQVRAETDAVLYEPHHITESPASAWIATHLKPDAALGYDPWLHTQPELDRYAAAAAKAGARLVPCGHNPVDAIWEDQPVPPLAPVRPHPIQYAGKPSSEKREELGARLAADKIDAAVLTAPDSIAWLLNIRGGDVPNTPLPLSFAIVRQDGGVELFCDRRKLVPELSGHLGNAVTVLDPDEFPAGLDRLGGNRRRVLADPGTAAALILSRLEKAGAEVVKGQDPCALPKACKNPVELAGARASHRRDGAALTRFLAWIKQEAPKGNLTEIEAVDRLAAIRRQGELYRGPSFTTIAGAGPNGAIVHYRASEATNRKLESGTLVLLDSGGQYLDGTTDVTRTLAIGTPTAEMRDRFTRVLKGHIALAMAKFPRGTSGSQLDTLARHALWQAGLDFDHGTGHGVGSYLGVHEGPQRISKVPNTVALQPGMIVSNEPGYYKTGAYGIRIENLVVVIEEGGVENAERPMLSFETLTLAPIDRDLVEPRLMAPDELAWLDAYHARVRETLSPLLDDATRAWLGQVTQPIAR